MITFLWMIIRTMARRASARVDNQRDSVDIFYEHFPHFILDG